VRHHRLQTSWLIGGATILGAFGLLERLWIWSHSAISADEAMVGLMANQVLQGHFFAFYWGQHYGGAESDVVAAMMGIFGHNPGALTATSLLLGAFATYLIYLLGRELFSRNVGIAAAALCWVWPSVVLWQSTREYGFRGVATVAGLTTLLMTARLIKRGSSPSRWVILGIAVGLGWWASPEVLYYAVPAGCALLVGGLLLLVSKNRLRPNPFRPLEMGIGALAGALGALPWIVNNLQTGFSSMTTPQNATTHISYGTRLHLLFVESLPIALGTKRPMSANWIDGEHTGLTILIVIVTVIAIGALGVVRHGALPAFLVVGFVAGYFFLMALFPETSYYADGRYVCYLPQILSLVIVAGWWRLLKSFHIRRIQLSSIAFSFTVASAAVLSLVGTLPFAPLAHSSVTLRPIGNVTGEDIALGLKAYGYRDVIAPYWVSYDLDFFGNGSVTATPLTPIRLPRIERRVFHSDQTAWLFIGPTPADRMAVTKAFFVTITSVVTLSATAFCAKLDDLGIKYTRVEVGPMVAVVPRGHPTWWIIDRFL